MTKREYDRMDNFPVIMVSLCVYKSNKTNLKPGDTFLGIRKVTLGEDDYSIIDDKGHPHHYTGCDKLVKE